MQCAPTNLPHPLNPKDYCSDSFSTIPRTLDSAVDASYRKAPFTSELERLEYLFGMYKELTKDLFTQSKTRRGVGKKKSTTRRGERKRK